MLFFSWEFFLRIAPSLVIQQITIQYNTNAVGIGSMAGVYYLGYSIIQVPAGIMIDKYPIKNIGLISLLICVISIIFFILNSSLSIAFILRFLMGVASAFSFIGVLAIAKRHFASNFSLITSLTISLGTVLAALSQIGASYFISASTNNWKAPFIILIISGMILLFLIILNKNFKNNINKNINNNFNNNIITKCVKLIKNPGILLNGIIGGLLYLPTSILADTWGIAFLKTKNHISSSYGAVLIMFLFLGWAIGSLCIGLLTKTNKKHKKLIQILGLLAIFSIIIIIYIPINNYLLTLLILLFGVGSSSQIIVWCDFNNREINPEDTGLAISIVNMLIIAISSLGQIIFGFLLTQANSYFSYNNQNIISLDAFYSCFWIMPIIIATGIITASFVFIKKGELDVNPDLINNQL